MEEFQVKILSYGSGAILDSNGVEVGKVRIESEGLTEEQRNALIEKIRADHQEAA